VANITAATEAPGDPKNVGSFINISNEQKLTAYLGFNDVAHLRTLLMSWPVLKAYLAFNPIAINMNKKSALRLLHDDRAVFDDFDNRKKLWSLLDTDDTHTTKTKKDRHLASILLELRTDLETLKLADKKKSRQRQTTYMKMFQEAVAKEAKPPTLPMIDFLPQLSTDRPLKSPCFQTPELGPRPGEDDLESFNRCWCIIKYFRECRQAQGMFDLRFSQDAINTSITVNIAHVPIWLRPKEEIERPEALDKAAFVLAADALPLLSVSIKWLKTSKFPNKEELDKLLDQADLADIPNARQIIRQDPRLTSSTESFKDHIRRLYNCQKLHTNIYALNLTYETVDNLTSGETEEQCKNILTQSWDETKSIFVNTTKNSNFVLSVVFEAADNPEASVYESFEPTPALTTFFDTSSGDILANTKGLKEMADAAFGKQQQQDPEDTNDDALKESGGLQAVLDLLFASGGSATDIGSCPDPRTKFKGSDMHEKLLEYYNGVDVTTPDGRREWQRGIAGLLSIYSQAASVKEDKLPTTLTQAQKIALGEAQSRGHCVAMSLEQDEEGDAVSSSD
jgi:hypothetical protein